MTAQLTSFNLTSSSPTTNSVITFSLTGNTVVTHWLVKEGSVTPSSSSSLWTSNKPSTFSLSIPNPVSIPPSFSEFSCYEVHDEHDQSGISFVLESFGHGFHICKTDSPQF